MKLFSRHVLKFAGVFAVLALVFGVVSGVVTSTVHAAPARADTPATGGLFQAATGRILDTRNGTGGYSAPFAAGWHSVSVDGVVGLPTSGISAVEVNITVVSPAVAGGVHADADGVSTPNASMVYLDYSATSTINFNNTAIIPVGSDGKIQVDPTTSVDMVIDVQGYYTSGATAAGGYVPVHVTSIANTATGVGVPLAQVPSAGVITAQVGGVGPVPATASSVVLSVAESSPSPNPGSLTVYSAGTAVPTGALQWGPGHNALWTTTVALPASGMVSVRVNSGGAVDIAIEVEGYFTASSGTTNGSFTPLAARLFDSRSPSAPLTSDDTDYVQISGVGDVPEIGSGIASVAVDITVLPGSSANGHMQVYADDATPGSAEIDYYTSYGAVSTLVVVPLGADGGIDLQNSSPGSVNFVVDIEGWYSAVSPTITGSVAPSPSAGSSSSVRPTFNVSATDPTGDGLLVEYDVYSTSPTAGTQAVTSSGWIVPGRCDLLLDSESARQLHNCDIDDLEFPHGH
jgi:hypothetical protein